MSQHHPAILTVPLAVAVASFAPSQQFAALQQTPLATPIAPQLANGIPADVDGNGTMDVLLRSGSVLLGDGNLGFTWSPPGVRVPTMPPFGLAGTFQLASDIDNDGDLDLIRTSGTLFPTVQSIVMVMTGSPAGFWATEQPAGTLNGLNVPVAARDVDGDGFADLFLTGTNTIALMRNLGNGTFVDVTAASLPTNQADHVLAFADVDGDNDVDIALRSGGVVQILRNGGTGTFTVHATSGLPAVPAIDALRFGDADGDGDQDLIVATARGAALQLWTNAGNGTFSPASVALPPHGRSTLFLDLDGDGDADLLTILDAGFGPFLTTWRNAGAAGFVQLPGALLDNGNELGDPALADLDGDGDQDLVVGGSLFFLGEGNQTWAPLQRQGAAFAAPANTVVAGDLDGDGDVDLVSGATVLRNDGTGHQQIAFQNLPAGAAVRAAFDADNDGDLDLVWTPDDPAATSSGGVVLNQAGVLVAQPPLPSGQLSGHVEHADFDGDGNIDLCSAAGVLLRNLGGGTFTPAGAPLPIDRVHAVGDFDGDGLVDLIGGSPANWSHWRNLGGFVFQQLTTSPIRLIAGAAGDIDGDGHLDFVGRFVSSSFGGSSGVLQVFMNQGGQLQLGNAYFDSPLARGVALADVDEDGALDLVGGAVWINQGAGAFIDRQSGIHHTGEVAAADLDRDGDLDLVYAGLERTDVFVNRHRHIGASRVPVLGQSYPIVMASQPGYSAGGALVVPALAFATIAPVVLPGLGVLHVDPLAVVFAPAALTGPDGTHTWSVQVPSNPALAGVPVAWQGLVLDGFGLRLTGLVLDRIVP